MKSDDSKSLVRTSSLRRPPRPRLSGEGANAWAAEILCLVSWERVTTFVWGGWEELRDRRQSFINRPVRGRLGGSSLLERLRALSGLSLENMRGDDTESMGEEAKINNKVRISKWQIADLYTTGDRLGPGPQNAIRAATRQVLVRPLRGAFPR